MQDFYGFVLLENEKKKKIVYTRDEYHLSRTSINRESVEKGYETPGIK